MNSDARTDFFACNGETEPTTPSTGDSDVDAALAEMAQTAEPPFDPDAYLEQKPEDAVACGMSETELMTQFDAAMQTPVWPIDLAPTAADDDALASLGPEIYGTFTMATPEQIVRQIERCWRENVPGWRTEGEGVKESAEERFLREWRPDTSQLERAF